MIEKILSSVKKETDRQYFFSRLNNPMWLEPLCKRGYFNSPPRLKHLPGGYVQYPNWPELAYLVNIAAEATEQIVSIILGLPKTDNPLVYDGILKIALKLKGQESAKLCPKIIEYTEIEHQFIAHRYPEILLHWANQDNVEEALAVVEKLVPFREDPKSQAKQQLRKKNLNDLGTSLEPAPRFEHWVYKQIHEKGIRPLAEKEPYQVALILIEAAADMIRMTMHQEDIDKGRDEDYSEIWCRQLEKPEQDDQAAKDILVHTLTYACKQVFEKSPESIEVLDQVLRSQRWKIFKRLHHYLYALHPNDQTLPWIREFILGHEDYSKWEYHYEFQLMIRRASEHFGSQLLREAEKTTIFDAILSGPSKDDFREWMGDRYSENAFQQRQRYFHRKQLRPFAALLRGKYRCYFERLESEEGEEVISDESYSPYKGVRSGVVTDRSPKSIQELESLSDDEILAYLNDWEEEQRDKGNWLVEINIFALAGVFQTFFKDKIVSDKARLTFWMANRDKIARPIYVVVMTKAMQELVKDKNFEKLSQWIEFCEWILSHPDQARDDRRPQPRDESREYPDWGSSRCAVVDFIDICLNKDVDAPISAREGFANLLQNVCTQFDWQLDRENVTILNHDSQIGVAINNTRSRALESLVRFGFWVRRYLPEDQLPEVTDILARRLAKGSDMPLTLPEYALLATNFGDLCTLNQDWATEQKKLLFPLDKIHVWRDAFGNFIRFNQPFKLAFDILREDFEFALENLTILESTKGSGKQLIDILGQHLFSYYIWEVFSLKGDESLLARFYKKTDEDREHWANLFDHVGRSFRNSGKSLKKELIDRAIAFFDWRFDAAEPLELQKFTFWLDAECLEPEWRLRYYSKILDLGRDKNVGFSIELRSLNKLLPDNVSSVVECFAKITDALDQSNHYYVSADEANPILKAGLRAKDIEVRKNAERARENLLRFGRFDFLDTE